MADRMLKINELLSQKLGEVINRTVEMPDIFVTIVRVTTSSNLQFATVYVSVMPDEKAEYAVHKLNLLSKRLRGELLDEIVLRSVPRLEFRLDKSERIAAGIDELLDSLKDEIKEE